MVESKGEHLLNQGHTLAVEFIENKLPNYHPFFKNPPVRYDHQVAHYVDFPPQAPEVPIAMRPGPAVLPAPAPGPGVRPKEDAFKSMTYWKMIFPSAMEKFQDMPEVKVPKPREAVYDIRNGKSWTDVYNKLEDARDYYMSKTSFRGRIRCVWRWTADNAIEPARIVTKVLPQIDIITPVLAAVQIILEAAKNASEVQKLTFDAFEELESVFSDVELFLGTFREKELILEQAVRLVASVLLAIERAIAYFTRSIPSRTVKAIGSGKDYEKHLRESLADITSQSKKLMEQALKTHIHDFHGYSRATLRILQLLHQKQDGMNAKAISTMDAMNSQLALLMDMNEEQRRMLGRLFIEGAKRVEHLENIIRNASPDSTWAPPPRSPYVLSWLETPCINQKDLWDLVKVGETDLDTSDMEEIEEMAQQLPLQDRAQTEQIVYDEIFQEWIVSPRSSKLMVYSNFSGFMMKTSALSLFCTTLTKAFRLRKSYLCLVWFCGRHLGSDDDSYLDSSESEDGLSEDIGLVHAQEDDYSPETKQGPIKRMIRSLITQLLCDYDFGPRHLLPPDIDPYDIQEGHSLSQLTHLFCWLVRQLPRDFTLFCLIDGIVFYEREDIEDPMLDVLGDLLELTV